MAIAPIDEQQREQLEATAVRTHKPRGAARQPEHRQRDGPHREWQHRQVVGPEARPLLAVRATLSGSPHQESEPHRIEGRERTGCEDKGTDEHRPLLGGRHDRLLAPATAGRAARPRAPGAR